MTLFKYYNSFLSPSSRRVLKKMNGAFRTITKLVQVLVGVKKD